MDNIHKQEFQVRDLPTRSVTLFPTRAQVVRDVKNIKLQPGANQITIVGFTPTMDENSIKVEGTGSAVISDISVELLPNRELVDEVYPESDDDSMESDATDDDEPLGESKELKAARDRLAELQDEKLQVQEAIASAESRVQILDAYSKVLNKREGVKIEEELATYRAERARAFVEHTAARQKKRELQEALVKAEREERKLVERHDRQQEREERARAKERRARDKARDLIRQRMQERQRERARVRREQLKLWPRQVYTVRITLDADLGSGYTPASSRRGSIASVEVARPDKARSSEEESALVSVGDEEGEGLTCDLAVSYVTTSAFWAPTYDVQLLTTTGAAVLCFDAHLTNTTSETWAGCKLVLSTSQTAFAGLHDAIPTLVPWRVRLVKTAYGNGLSSIINSHEELANRALGGNNSLAGYKTGTAPNQKLLSELFGPPDQQAQTQSMPAQSFAAKTRLLEEQLQKQRLPQGQQQQQQQRFGSSGPAFGSSVFGVPPVPPPPPPPATGAYFGMARAAPPSRAPPPAPSMPMPRFRSTQVRQAGEAQSADEKDTGESESESGPDTIEAGPPEMAFQESGFEETGLTTTYDLPGLKTLASSATATRQRVVRLRLPAGSAVFRHTVVAKYRASAYLQVRIRNASKITLLRGPAGLTLDGAFLGRTTLPRCSAGDIFPLNLGVDPAIRVVYPKPDVKRAGTGGSLLFNKDNASVFRRSITLTSTRAVATLLVLDQVPVSEDEKLRVGIQQPRGLSVDGAGVACGTAVVSTSAAAATDGGSGSGSGSASQNWGRATATLKKAGQVAWDVKLNAGRTVRLELEYSVTVPQGEGAEQC